MNEKLYERIVREHPGISYAELARRAGLHSTSKLFAGLYWAVNIYEGDDGLLYFYEWKKRS